MTESEMPRKFILYFPPSFVNGDRTKRVYTTFFTNHNGFRNEEITDILRMKVDDVLHVSELKIWRAE